jgi:hypothetical protein
MGSDNPSTSNWRFGAGPVHGNERLDKAVFAERDAPTSIDPSAKERFYATELEERIAALKSKGLDASDFERALAGIRGLPR